MSIDRQSLTCGARTRKGGRCKRSPTPGSNPPRCHLHHKARPRPPDKQPCTGLTGKGKPCRGLALPHSHPPRCIYHGPPQSPHRRCAARTKRGRPCRAWATHDSQRRHGRPLCAVHSGRACRRPRRHSNDNDGAHEQHDRACRARTRSGKPCGNWAMRDSQRRHGRPLCYIHAAPAAWRRPGPQSRSRGQRCTAHTPSGDPCRNWAMHRSKERYGAWLCLLHAEGGHVIHAGPQSRVRNRRQCTARTPSGERCRHWALSDESWPGDEPLCAHHARHDMPIPVRHGYYSKRPRFSPQQRAAILQAVEDGEPLAAELLIVRLKLSQLLQYLAREDLPQWRRDAAASALFNGVRTVKRLMEARYNLARIRWRPSSGGNSGMQLASLLQEEE